MCPLGCELTIKKLSKTEYQISGNTCPRGEEYGRNEMVNPTRNISSLIKLAGGGVVPVKTSAPIPKNMIFKVTNVLKDITLKNKPAMGAVVIKDVLGLGVDIVSIGL